MLRFCEKNNFKKPFANCCKYNKPPHQNHTQQKHTMKNKCLTDCRVLVSIKDTDLFLKGAAFTECFDKPGFFYAKDPKISLSLAVPEMDFLGLGLLKVISTVPAEQTERFRLLQEDLYSEVEEIEKQIAALRLKMRRIKSQIKAK